MKTTLGEWGRKLPVGMVEGDKFNREFTFRDLNFGVEREVQKLVAKEETKTLGSHATLVLSQILTSLGGQRLDPAKYDETRALLAKCWLADVMYMWLWARRESCGKDLEINFPCTNQECRFVESPTPVYDLDSFDVVTADSVDQLHGQYATKTPYEVRGQTVNAFRLQPPTWSIYMGNDAVSAEMDAKVMLAGICGTDKHESILLTDQEVDCFRRLDHVGVQAAINKLVFGPKLVVEHACPKCHRESKLFLDWQFDSFFS
jgi:hypothetical protein